MKNKFKFYFWAFYLAWYLIVQLINRHFNEPLYLAKPTHILFGILFFGVFFLGPTIYGLCRLKGNIGIIFWLLLFQISTALHIIVQTYGRFGRIWLYFGLMWLFINVFCEKYYLTTLSVSMIGHVFVIYLFYEWQLIGDFFGVTDNTLLKASFVFLPVLIITLFLVLYWPGKKRQLGIFNEVMYFHYFHFMLSTQTITFWKEMMNRF